MKIERSRMYPITVLSGLIPEDEIAELVKFGVVSTRDLIEKEVKVGDKALEVAKVLYETELNEHS